MMFPRKLTPSILLILLVFTIEYGREGTIKPVRSANGNIETLIIDPYTQTCQGFIEQQGYLEFNEESQEWEFFYEAYKDLTLSRGISTR